jgi:2-polyprenyl-6-hydroxyphenyl methylase/3-demethylubiquinone-9 3-methyltransferase
MNDTVVTPFSSGARTVTPPSGLLTVTDAPPCKCCGASTATIGSVDFGKSCEDRRQSPDSALGLPIEYRRCGSCGFVFTLAFDRFSPQDFHTYIYNDEYVRADPDFVEVRPRSNADLITELFRPSSRKLRLLDYGGGNGLLARLLRERGWAAASYDPFYPEHGRRPAARFQIVSCFEVLEHSPTPFDTLRDLRWFMDDGGLILFSTLLQPADFERQGLGWWYAAPRNGHVSLYSRAAMNALMRKAGLSWTSFNENLHLAFRRRLPAFARHLARSA